MFFLMCLVYGSAQYVQVPVFDPAWLAHYDKKGSNARELNKMCETHVAGRIEHAWVTKERLDG